MTLCEEEKKRYQATLPGRFDFEADSTVSESE